ncbi:hypothetical protein J2Y45_005508 [Dyadobacter sp. BE34]|uniref:Glycosyltransferase RgtA/B/C/D-like domain-containing protein n=1 Tax=Dyadobacter fermentans TaxID=94254 RepID=A0ABU1R401_9BACT|nr:MULTISPECIES: hypothetical protein [Dyadobacter]MDR6808143.1 hypothetical protein [Dyadobacter fermentans]MDR7046041.1 hypothetical protein [Dyadobacter sp. BE242]MDR7200354.1 hypothetical protein [Dyadobacter sp. BE34]MDR7218314.1 hypothetical protein [Dyadobacter sp. BE31]MDR7266245.1 hypothetical protein [Dyadobacter sp. BE32]
MKLFLEDPHLFEYYSLVVVLLLLFGATFLVEKIKSWRQWTGIGLILLPVLYFFILLDAHLVNIPYTDDFNLLETVQKLRNSGSVMEMLKALFEQVNQHRFGFERIVMLIMFVFTGTVNIKTQIIIGDLFMLGIGYLLYLSLKREGISWYWFIPVPYILFNLVYFENAYWGIAALQNTPLIFFAMLTAYGLARDDEKGFRIGLIAALLTTFTSGSGLLAWIVGMIILVFQKRFKNLLWWLAASIAVLMFYFFFDYQFVSSQGEKVWNHPVFNAIFVMAFWGNALYLDVRHPLVPVFHKDMIACVVLGAGITFIFAAWALRILLARKPTWSDWFLLGTMMFIMGTGAMFVISRPINNYVMYGGTVFSRRYMIFGIVLVAACYVCVVIVLKNFKSWKKLAAIVAMLFFVGLNFVSYFTSIVSIRKLHDDLVIDSYFWKNYKTFLTIGDLFTDIPFWNHPTRMRDLIISLESDGITDFYQFYDMPAQEDLIRQTKSGNPFAGRFDAQSQYRNGESNHSVKYFKFFVTPEKVQKEAFYIVLESEQHTIVLPAVPEPNTVSDFLQKASYYSNNYQYSLYKAKLPEGKYRAWIMSRGESGKWESAATGKQVLFY